MLCFGNCVNIRIALQVLARGFRVGWTHSAPPPILPNACVWLASKVIRIKAVSMSMSVPATPVPTLHGVSMRRVALNASALMAWLETHTEGDVSSHYFI